jgi:alkanesulfonate monooxygenase SsuD/methylene tetrahydromethanopterin reductase-like flavin-dependent oxidoreductase (luciferase family)
VARDIITRELPESVTYARAQRARHVLVVGSPRTGADQILALDLEGGAERTLSVREVLEDPGRYFAEGKESGHA